MSSINQVAFADFTQSILDHVEAEGDRLGMPVQEVILGVVAIAMRLSVDSREGDVEQGELDVIVLAEMIGGEMREWPIEDRFLQEAAIN